MLERAKKRVLRRGDISRAQVKQASAAEYSAEPDEPDSRTVARGFNGKENREENLRYRVLRPASVRNSQLLVSAIGPKISPVYFDINFRFTYFVNWFT